MPSRRCEIVHDDALLDLSRLAHGLRACVRVRACVVVQYGAFCVMGCCASVVQVVGTALLVSKSDGIEQLAISIKEADGGGLGQQ